MDVQTCPPPIHLGVVVTVERVTVTVARWEKRQTLLNTRMGRRRLTSCLPTGSSWWDESIIRHFADGRINHKRVIGRSVMLSFNCPSKRNLNFHPKIQTSHTSPQRSSQIFAGVDNYQNVCWLRNRLLSDGRVSAGGNKQSNICGASVSTRHACVGVLKQQLQTERDTRRGPCGTPGMRSPDAAVENSCSRLSGTSSPLVTPVRPLPATPA